MNKIKVLMPFRALGDSDGNGRGGKIWSGRHVLMPFRALGDSDLEMGGKLWEKNNVLMPFRALGDSDKQFADLNRYDLAES